VLPGLALRYARFGKSDDAGEAGHTDAAVQY